MKCSGSQQGELGPAAGTLGSVSFGRFFVFCFLYFSAFVSVLPSLSDFPAQASSSPHPFPVSPFPPQLRCTQPCKPQQCSVGSPPPARSPRAGLGGGNIFMLSAGWDQGPALGPERGHLEFLITLVTWPSASDGCHPQPGP